MFLRTCMYMFCLMPEPVEAWAEFDCEKRLPPNPWQRNESNSQGHERPGVGGGRNAGSIPAYLILTALRFERP